MQTNWVFPSNCRDLAPSFRKEAIFRTYSFYRLPLLFFSRRSVGGALHQSCTEVIAGLLGFICLFCQWLFRFVGVFHSSFESFEHRQTKRHQSMFHRAKEKNVNSFSPQWQKNRPVTETRPENWKRRFHSVSRGSLGSTPFQEKITRNAESTPVNWNKKKEKES